MMEQARVVFGPSGRMVREALVRIGEAEVVVGSARQSPDDAIVAAIARLGYAPVGSYLQARTYRDGGADIKVRLLDELP